MLLALLVAALFSLTLQQMSPLNIGDHQVVMIGFIPQQGSSIMNFTVRFPIQTAYNILFQFSRSNPNSSSTAFYLSFSASNTAPLLMSEMTFANNQLQNQPASNQSFFELSRVNAESYDEFRFFISKSLSSFSKNSIYTLSVYMDPNMNLTSWREKRQAYFHTFLTTDQNPIIMPRLLMQDSLTTGPDNYNLYLFTGGIQYAGNSVYFIGLIVNTSYVSSVANMWAGFSFSSSHINRDMITFKYNSTGVTVSDTYSLLGIAPFEDTTVEVGGSNNVQKVVGVIGVGYSTVLVRRLYNTGDMKGDQEITVKLNQQFCLAMFTESPGASMALKDSPIHNYLKCITPDIGLGGDMERGLLVLISLVGSLLTL